MKLKRLLAVVLVGTMAASMASGAAVSAEEKQKLVIWSWGADEEKKAREDAVAIFQENHPEIEVEHSVIPTADHAWDQKDVYKRQAHNGGRIELYHAVTGVRFVNIQRRVVGILDVAYQILNVRCV